MRTTLDLADDVLQTARDLARREKKTLGEVVSELARRALVAPIGTDQPGLTVAEASPLAAYGIQPLPPRGGLVSDELVSRLRDQEGI